MGSQNQIMPDRYVGTDYESTLAWLAPLFVVALAATIVGLAVFPPGKPIPAPANASVFGCYTAPRAPPIILDAQGMQVVQTGFPKIGFRLERQKFGIVLTAEAPIDTEEHNGRFRYFFDQDRESRYLNFYNIIGGQRCGVFDNSELNQFTVLTRQGTLLPYKKLEIQQVRDSLVKSDVSHDDMPEICITAAKEALPRVKPGAT